VTANPPHPGAFTWLDARTLQFRPAEPWPPLERFTWTVDGNTARFATLMEPPTGTIPSNNAERLEAVDSISLTFAEPLDELSLVRMVTGRAPLPPGDRSRGSRWLKSDDFTLKVIERKSSSDAATYVLNLRKPDPAGDAGDRPPPSLARGRPDTVVHRGHVLHGRAVPRGLLWVRRRPGAGHAGGEPVRREQALRCDPNNRRLVVRFSSAPSGLARSRRATSSASRRRLTTSPTAPATRSSRSPVTSPRRPCTASRSFPRRSRTPTAGRSTCGARARCTSRSPVRTRTSTWRLPRDPRAVRTQMVPLAGRGDERVDLRIHRIDRSTAPSGLSPTVRSRWTRPTGHPDRASARSRSPRPISRSTAANSPTRSRLSARPPSRRSSSSRCAGRAARRRSGSTSSRTRVRRRQGQPGTYLVGIRRLDGGSRRSWMRVQVTDLAARHRRGAHGCALRRHLSVHRRAGRRSPRPRRGLRRGGGRHEVETLFDGVTDAQGTATWQAPGNDPHKSVEVRRIVVQKGVDLLVLDPRRAPTATPTAAGADAPALAAVDPGGPDGTPGSGADAVPHLHRAAVYRPEDTVYIKATSASASAAP